MTTTHPSGRQRLQRLAHQAMLQRGLLPDFSPAVIAETDRITQAAAPSDRAIRDLRGLLWASIDNDDSRDLDQLSAAEPMPAGAVKILVAAPRYGFELPPSPGGQQFVDAYTQAINRVLAGDQTPRQALDQAQKEAQKAIDDNRK